RAGSRSRAPGDVNGDGREDLLVGATPADANGTDSGAAYVLYGKATPTSVTLNNAGLPPSDGFLIRGAAAGDLAGTAVAGAGDVNGDGRDDIIVGADFAPISGAFTGAAYVLYGKATPATITLSDTGLPATDGYLIKGASAGDTAGSNVAGIGDINGDGKADVAVGAFNADANGVSSGAVYVLYGKATPATITLSNTALPPADGYLIRGATGSEGLGAVADAGDVNGDGRRDLIVGAPFAPGDGSEVGAAYVVYGKATPATLTLNDVAMPAADGYLIKGAATGDRAGIAVGAVDFNGDGKGDPIVGAYTADANGTDSGAAYVLYGNATPATVTLSNTALPSAEGFLIIGAAAGDEAGVSVAGLGDVNGDGRRDAAIGAYFADANGTNSGAASVLYGGATASTLTLSNTALPPAVGYVMRGANAGEFAGTSVADAGDVNGDGRPDVVVGAERALTGGVQTGASYVLLGFGTPQLSYPTGAISGRQDTAIAALTPSVRRTGPASFSVAPALPPGLTLDPATGVISGKPTASAALSVHTITMTDLAGAVSAPMAIQIKDTHRPVVSKVKLTRKRFAVSGRKRGTTLSFSLSEAASVRIAIQRPHSGRRKGGKCVAPTKKLHKAKKCTRYVTLGALSRSGRTGTNRVVFTGRLKGRALARGAYRFSITATDAAGNVTSKAGTIAFTVTRAAKPKS
ncbi:MAG: hypothetical protein V7607_6493, partial [Solirubrobacteraceae bacterium]